MPAPILQGGDDYEYVTCIMDGQNEEFDKLQKVQCRRVDCFMESLTKEQRKAVLEIEREENVLRAMLDESMFVQSFKWGAQLMLEILR